MLLCVCACVSRPFDTIRRRLQMQSEMPKGQWLYKSLSWPNLALFSPSLCVSGLGVLLLCLFVGRWVGGHLLLARARVCMCV